MFYFALQDSKLTVIRNVSLSLSKVGYQASRTLLQPGFDRLTLTGFKARHYHPPGLSAFEIK